MTDDLRGDDPLQRVVEQLRSPIGVPPGLVTRARRSRQRRFRRRLASATVGITAVAAVVLVLLRRDRVPAITFALDAPSSQSVALVGDFTDWQSDRIRMQHERSGVWEVTLRLPPGRYRFAYLVDNTEWRADPHAVRAGDDFGRPTSVITVAGD